MDFSTLGSAVGGLNDLYSQYQSTQNAANTGNQVNNLLGLQQGLYNNQAGLQAGQVNNINQSYNDLYGLQSGLTLGNIANLQNQTNNTAQLQNGALGLLNEQRGGLNNFMSGLQGQIGKSSQQGQDLFGGALGLLNEQRGGYQQDIDRQTAGLNAFMDPNSSYMQQARQAIERQDAAAGRRSQWGDREVQLAALGMENYGKYAPGLQQGIQASRNAMSNDMGLAGNLFGQFVNTPNQLNQGLQQLIAGGFGQQTKDLTAGADILNSLGQQQDRTNALLSQNIGGMGNLASLLNSQYGNLNNAINGIGSAAQGLGTAANNANTTGRQAGYSTGNQTNQLVNSGLGMLSKLFGGGGSGFDLGDSSISGLSNLMGQLGNGLGDWSAGGNSMDSFWNQLTGSGGLGFNLDSLFGNDTISGGDGIGYGYDGVSGGITDLMKNILGE